MKTRSHQQDFPTLLLAAIGIVFGDIGTSPLYTLKVVVDLSGGKPSPEVALSLLSLIIWALLITVSVKYVFFVMRADNQGEGGILALMALLKGNKMHRGLTIAIGLFGAALIYGDGVLTPAISVLSAVEGIKIVDPGISHYILPISLAILIVLFAVQFLGTAKIGWIFGPIMVLWFIILAILGIRGILLYPGVLAAFNPWHAVKFLLSGGYSGFLVLGGVFLAVTGAEALYADMGHFGVRPIRLAWYGLVLPSLLLNYAGQTALVMSGSNFEDSIFYRLSPPSLLVAVICVATLATIVASQAIITGIFSMTRQAIQLGWSPRLNIRQTSSESYGQIYIGSINWILMFVTLALAASFGSSDRLAGAYGIAVSLTMFLTTILLYFTMRENWGWSLASSSLTAGIFCLVDLAFLSGNMMKILEGGWVPLLLASGVFFLMRTWHQGASAVAIKMRGHAVPVEDFMKNISDHHVPRVPGVAVFMDKLTEQTPPIIIWHVTHNRALHFQVVALAIVVRHTPWVKTENRLKIEKLGENFWRFVADYGFMETIDIPELLKRSKAVCQLDLSDVTYYIGHETVLHGTGSALPAWEEKVYAFLQRNSAQINEYFSLPRNKVVEIGRQIEI
ncbi:MAG: potassium transporter Kup [Nitrospiria bacterium]